MSEESKDLSQLVEGFKAATAEVKSLKEKHDAELKEMGAASAETKSALQSVEQKQTEIGETLSKLDEKLIQLETEQKQFRPGGPAAQRKSLGELFTTSEVYEQVKSQGRGNNAPASFQRKDITSLTASAGALIRPDRDPEVYRDPSRPTRIRDLIPAIPTQSGSVETMRLNVFTNEAGPQGTASGLGAGEFVAKNESNVTWELVTYPVRTIAHFVPASRQALSDAPMLQNLIDVELTYGLDLESDNQLLLGDGTGQNVTGLLVDADIPDVGELANGTATADIPSAMIEHIRSAVTTLQTNEYYNPNGIVLNPVDWGTLETAKASDGHYLMIQFPANGADQRIWRMPVVVTNAMPEGQFLLGDWTLGSKLYEREDVSVRISESHADYFVRNGVAVLAEERYAFAVNRPNAYVKGQFTVSAT